jgi:hypothetical protein
MSIRPLALQGWDELSTWGYDDQLASFYAQLTRNGNSDDDGPEIWLSPPRYPVLASEAQLRAAIAECTGTPVEDVARALSGPA